MAYAGQVLENPVTGERIVFRKTSADTDGAYAEIDLVLAPDGAVPGTHVHPKQVETFEVISGQMKFRMGMKMVKAGPGETVVVPAGAVHNFANAGSDTAHVRVTMTPALKMEELFETTVGLAMDGRVNRHGMPKPLDLALFVERFEDEARAPFPPAAVVRVLLAPLRFLARRRGRSLSRSGSPRPASQAFQPRAAQAASR
jgi:mannose-6-phosphate isomerase-like protein (cupin superfamily)